MTPLPFLSAIIWERPVSPPAPCPPFHRANRGEPVPRARSTGLGARSSETLRLCPRWETGGTLPPAVNPCRKHWGQVGGQTRRPLPQVSPASKFQLGVSAQLPPFPGQRWTRGERLAAPGSVGQIRRSLVWGKSGVGRRGSMPRPWQQPSEWAGKGCSWVSPEGRIQRCQRVPTAAAGEKTPNQPTNKKQSHHLPLKKKDKPEKNHKPLKRKKKQYCI